MDQRGFKVKIHPTQGTKFKLVDAVEATTEEDISRCHMVKVDIINYLPDVVVYTTADSKEDAISDTKDIWANKLHVIREYAGIDSEDVLDLIVNKSVQREHNYG